MSQWAEIGHLHQVEDVPKREIARRLKLDVKTVRRTIGRPAPRGRVSSSRPSSLDPWRERIMQWLREEAVDRELDSPVAAAVGRAGPRAHGAALRRGAEDNCGAEGRLCAPQRAAPQDHGGRLRRVVGRHHGGAVQGVVPSGDAPVLQRVLRQGVPSRAA